MSMSKNTFSAGAALMLLWSSPAWAGDIYYWIDDDGVKHFTNQAPPANSKLFVENTYRAEQQTASNRSATNNRQMEEI